MLAYHNGQYLPLADVRISPLDPGFSGVAVVDNARTFGGKLFRWPQHVARLLADCATCRIPFALDEQQLTEIAQHLLGANGVRDRDLHVVTVATPGPTVFVHMKEVNAAKYGPYFERGVSLAPVIGDALSKYCEIPPRSVKHRSRMLWHMVETCDRAAGTELVLEDFSTAQLLETSFANLLVVKDGVVCSQVKGRVLAGITAAYVEELCGRLGIHFTDNERLFSSRGPARLDEAMLAGSGFGLAGISKIGDTTIPWPGPVFQKLYAAFCADVGCDLAATLTPSPSCGPSRS